MSHEAQAQPDPDLIPKRDMPEERISATAGPRLSGAAASYRPGPDSFVYAIGKIEARFPRLSIEKEFAQVAGRAETSGQTDNQVFYEILSAPENRHLSRLLCWVLTVREIETYILLPRDSADFSLLVEAIRPAPSPMDLDVVIGTRGPIAPPDLCNGLMLPIVAFNQIYSFDRDSLISAIPRLKSMSDEQFDAASTHVLDRILQVSDNAGGSDEHRALNYLAMRYPEIYRKTAQQFSAQCSLSGVDVRRSPLADARNIVDCIFSYTERRSGFTEKFAVSVDITDEFPFLVGGMSAYYDRSGPQ
jgi:PatG C-terminal